MQQAHNGSAHGSPAIRHPRGGASGFGAMLDEVASLRRQAVTLLAMALSNSMLQVGQVRVAMPIAIVEAARQVLLMLVLQGLSVQQRLAGQAAASAHRIPFRLAARIDSIRTDLLLDLLSRPQPVRRLARMQQRLSMARLFLRLARTMHKLAQTIQLQQPRSVPLPTLGSRLSTYL